MKVPCTNDGNGLRLRAGRGVRVVPLGGRRLVEASGAMEGRAEAPAGPALAAKAGDCIELLGGGELRVPVRRHLTVGQPAMVRAEPLRRPSARARPPRTTQEQPG